MFIVIVAVVIVVVDIVDVVVVVPDDLWCAWRTVVDEWDGKSKKKASYIKVIIFAFRFS